MVNDVRNRLRHALASDQQHIAVLGWREAMPELDAAIRLDDFGAYLFDIILYVIVALATVNNSKTLDFNSFLSETHRK